MPPLRIWQLSQQALSGLVAGLLIQPKARKASPAAPLEESPWKLKAKIAKLEREVVSLKSLVDLLRAFPVHREAPGDKEVDPGRARKKSPCGRAKKGNRKKVRRAQSEPGAAADDGARAGGDGADDPQLDAIRG